MHAVNERRLGLIPLTPPRLPEETPRTREQDRKLEEKLAAVERAVVAAKETADHVRLRFPLDSVRLEGDDDPR